jgi:hypothetical protein
MTKTALVAAATAAVLAASTLAACGDDNGGSSGDEDQITKAIEAAASSGDPSACTQYQTLRFLEQTNGGATGQAAVKSCEQDSPDTAAAESVDVSDIEVDGDTATAKATATGSIFDGQTLVVALVKEGDQWKLDEFKGFEDFNRDALIAATNTEIAKESGVTPQAADCVAGQLEKQSDEQLQALYTGNNPNAEQQVFGPCSQYFQRG